MRLVPILAVACAAVLLSCGSTNNAKRAGTGASSGSPGARGGKEIVRTFPSSGVSRVVFRAALAKEARVSSVEEPSIVVTGTPRGGAPGYHPGDSKWRETAPQDWGLDFRGKVFANTLVVSTVNEIRYIHHHYYLDGLTVSLPKGVEIILETRDLSGEGAPDLREPQ